MNEPESYECLVDIGDATEHIAVNLARIATALEAIEACLTKTVGSALRVDLLR